jgi:two-component system, sensor histidine kinase PdtaS
VTPALVPSPSGTSRLKRAAVASPETGMVCASTSKDMPGRSMLNARITRILLILAGPCYREHLTSVFRPNPRISTSIVEEEGRGNVGVLQDLRTIQSLPLWIRLAVMGVTLCAAYLAQIPLERDWPGEPFLLFLLVVIGTTLCFGTRTGLLSVALSVFLSLYFFEPVGSPTLRYASDLGKIVVYALLAFGCVGGFSYLVKAFIERSDADKKKSTLLRELTHGVANNFAAIAALIHTAREAVSVEDSKAKSVLDDAIEQVKVMARVHRRLRASGHDVSLDSKVFIHELCDDLRASMARNGPISIECKADSLALCIDDAVSLGLIINELITNATKHAFPSQRVGRIRVCFEVQNRQSRLSVEDDGVGFDDRRNVGIGEDLVRGLSHQLGADLQVKTSKAGSTFSLSIPHLSPATQRAVTTSGG